MDQATGPGGVIPGFDALYREHFGFVYACLLRQGVPSAAIDDAVQDVFVAVHRRLPDFEGRSAIRTWLFGILRRVAFRHRRTAARVEHRRRALATVTPDEVGLAESLEHAERSAQLLTALDRLDDDKRAALTLHVFEELPGPELAAMLGIHVDTAYSRIKAARRELQRALHDMGVLHDEPSLIAATRAQTTADRGAARRVAAALAVRLGGDAGGAAVATWVGYKSVFAAIALGAVATVALADGAADAPRGAALTHLATVAQATPTAGPARPPPAELPAASAPILDAAPNAPSPDPHSPSIDLHRPSPDHPPSPGHPPSIEPQGPTAIPAGAPAVAPEAARRDDLAAALAAEVALITAAKAALDHDDPSGALAELAEHARRFPRGQLAAERAGYRAIALCAAGKRAAGRGEARVFASTRPDSSLLARIERACGPVSDP